ncbi:MAG TPA: hypothetical protein VK892_10250 [Pyrinomonadaceae bacterium]|nr:hypothetical protein [Pyrinomonadaceae bacterium]
MEVTIDLPENLAIRLESNRQNLPQIIEAGLREFRASSSIGYKSLADVLEFLAGLPEPEEILALRPSEDLQAEIERLLEKNRNEGLNESEEQTWASYEFIEHLVRIA